MPLPDKAWAAEHWDANSLAFKPLDADVFEQEHYTAGTLMLTVDYEMFAPVSLQPNEVAVLRVKKVKPNSVQSTYDDAGDYRLDIEGFSPDGEAVFTYTNEK